MFAWVLSCWSGLTGFKVWRNTLSCNEIIIKMVEPNWIARTITLKTLNSPSLFLFSFYSGNYYLPFMLPTLKEKEFKKKNESKLQSVHFAMPSLLKKGCIRYDKCIIRSSDNVVEILSYCKYDWTSNIMIRKVLFPRG